MDAVNTDGMAALSLLARMRFACGDNGKRMQDELEEYLRGLKRDSDRLAAVETELAALRAWIAAAPVYEVRESGWGDESGDGRVYGIPDAMIGQRVRLLPDSGEVV